MNILYFLTPKSDVTYVYDDFSFIETLNVLEEKRYSAIPIINKNGKYIGTLTEGDMLWAIKNDFDLSVQNPEKIQITQVQRRKDNQPVKADANMEDLVSKAMSQNFVPVIDDNGIFIGIITRKDIIQYCYTHCEKQEKVRK
ncbi:CBS domain-containing protein [Clostridium sp. Marseille-P299]|uniref:CBS domain-containing protein n=1 Tax=Clostridium sp. Marseille-P299 TaxID=1805477 RepID=UPI00082EC9CB|nr:CBS domain-containing protein [Clostridium sp. Marseille-P299]